jgi:hypothetical protein
MGEMAEMMLDQMVDEMLFGPDHEFILLSISLW